MREKGQTEVAKTLETPVFSRGIEILTEKEKLRAQSHLPRNGFFLSPSGGARIASIYCFRFLLLLLQQDIFFSMVVRYC